MKLLIGMLLWAFALVAVWEKVDIYRTGYAIEYLQAKKKQVEQEQRGLQLELAKLTSPEQIERLAVSRLGMVRPRYDQVVMVGTEPENGGSGRAGRVVPAAHVE